MTVADIQQIWNSARDKIVEECGSDKAKLMAAEILGLRKLAVEILAASMSAPKVPQRKQKPFTR